MRLVNLMALFLLSLTVGCSLGSTGSLPDIPIPELTPEPQPFRAQTSFVDGVLSIAVPTEDGRTRTLDTVRNVDASWGLYLPRPLQPNHSSREWILTDNHYDGRVLLYAVVDWDNADPTDYLAAGWWLAYPPGVPARAVETATRGVFLDGPELDPANPPDLPLTGTATYVGGAGGLYTYNYGRSWNELAGSSETAEFAGPISLTADFDQNRLTGCLGCLGPIEIDSGRHLYPILTWRTPDPTALPADYDLHFEASFGTNGAFEDTADHRDASRPHHHDQCGNVAGTVLERAGRRRQSPPRGRFDRRALRRRRRLAGAVHGHLRCTDAPHVHAA